MTDPNFRHPPQQVDVTTGVRSIANHLPVVLRHVTFDVVAASAFGIS